MIDLPCIYMIWLRDTIRYFREKSQLYGSIARPLLWLFILGMGLRGSFQVSGEVSYTQFIFPGIVAMAVIFTSIQSAITIIWDREFGFMKEILVAPVPRTSIIIGKCLSGTTLSLIQASVVMLLSPFVHVWIHPVNIVPLILVVCVVSFALTGVGVLIAARMTSFQGFGTIMNFVIMPMWFLSGSMFPPKGLPHVLDALVRLNPLTYGVDLLRRLVLDIGYYPPVLSVVYMVAFGLVMVFLAELAFNRGEF
jgi:ABC-2 type transport system permease protein